MNTPHTPKKERPSLNRPSLFKKRVSQAESFELSSNFFQPKELNKTVRKLNDILTLSLPNKENREDIQTYKAKSRAFKKIETRIEKNTKRSIVGSKLLLIKSKKPLDPWELRNSTGALEKERDKQTSPREANRIHSNLIDTEDSKSSHLEDYKRMADYDIGTLQSKCPFTRYQIYTLFSTFNAIVSDSVAFKGVNLSFNTHRFINDVATMLKVEVSIVKRIFTAETKKKYYTSDRNFQFTDFLSFVDQVRKESLREKVNDFLNLIFDIEKDSLSYSDMMSLFMSKSSQKDYEAYINKLFMTLMKSKGDRVRKQELKELFEANEDMLEMFRKIIF